MTARSAALAAAAALLLVGATAAPPAPGAGPEPFSEAPLPHYPVRRAAVPPVVDGRLDEFDWAVAPQIDAFHRILNDYGRVLSPTRARLLWDDDNLYVAFACRDADLWALFSAEDDPMWSEEVVEVFIDPDGDGRDYLEVEVNPVNAVVDLHIGQVQPDWVSSVDWDIAGLRTAVATHGTVNDSTDVDAGWTAEIAIPWAAFSPAIVGGGRPAAGDRWRLNLYRIERGAGAGVRRRLIDLQERASQTRQRLEGLGDADRAGRAALEDELARLDADSRPLAQREHQETEYTAWSPTFRQGFHDPTRFGVVEFAP